MGNKRKGDSVNDNELCDKQPRQSITFADIKVEDTSICEFNSVYIKNETFITESLVPRPSLKGNSIDKMDIKFKMEPNPDFSDFTESLREYIKNFKVDTNVLSGGIKIEEDHIKIEESADSSKPINGCEENIKYYITNTNLLNGECSDEIKIEESKVTPDSVQLFREITENYNANTNISEKSKKIFREIWKWKRVEKCYVRTCEDRISSRHRIPVNIPELKRIWLERLGNMSELEHLSDHRLNKTVLVCGAHYIDACKNGSKLVRLSLPTLNMPGFTGEPSINNSFLYAQDSNI